MFLHAVSWNKHGKFIDDLNNDFISGRKDVYPESPEEAVNMIAHRMDTEGKINKKGKNTQLKMTPMRETRATTFLQKKHNVTCHKCGGKGHYAGDCPTELVSDDESASSHLEIGKQLQHLGHSQPCSSSPFHPNP